MKNKFNVKDRVKNNAGVFYIVRAFFYDEKYDIFMYVVEHEENKYLLWFNEGELSSSRKDIVLKPCPNCGNEVISFVDKDEESYIIRYKDQMGDINTNEITLICDTVSGGCGLKLWFNCDMIKVWNNLPRRNEC